MITVSSPFPLADIPRVFAWMEPFRARVSDDFSPKTMTDFIEWWGRQEAAGMKTWGVYRSGELGGVISFQQISPVVGTAHCTFKKTFWGSATTSEALRLAFAEMFEIVPKVSSPVFQTNKAMLGLLVKMGAKKEGVLEAHTMQNGKPVNLVMIGCFKNSFGKAVEASEKKAA